MPRKFKAPEENTLVNGVKLYNVPGNSFIRLDNDKCKYVYFHRIDGMYSLCYLCLLKEDTIEVTEEIVHLVCFSTVSYFNESLQNPLSE